METSSPDSVASDRRGRTAAVLRTLSLAVTTVIAVFGTLVLAFLALMASDPPECFLPLDHELARHCEEVETYRPQFILGGLALVLLAATLAFWWFRESRLARWGTPVLAVLLPVLGLFIVRTWF